MRGGINIAAKGAIGTCSRIVSKKVHLCYAPEKPSILAPSASYISVWKGYFGALKSGFRIKKFRMENLKSDWIEDVMAFDAMQIALDLGIYAATVIAKQRSTL